MSDKMKLIYFEGRGIAELTRLLFKLAGVDFIDSRLTREEWQPIKPTTPKGELPVLEVNGKMICESQAIARFVARENGLYGDNNWDAAVIDMIYDSVGGVFRLGVAYRTSADDAKAAALEKAKSSLESLENLVKQLKKGPYILGENVSLADAALYSIAETAQAVLPDLKFDACPTVTEIAERFSQIPSIADWIKSRPQTAI